MILLLKAIGIIVTSTGAAVALWGIPRKNGKFTRQGAFSLSLIMLGLVLSLSLETLQWTQQQDEKRYRQEIARIDNEWDNTLHQEIIEAKISYRYRQEMKPDEFAKYIGTAEISFIIAASGAESKILIRRLKFLHQDKNSDAEERIKFVVVDNEQVIVSAGEKIILLKKELMSGPGKDISVNADDISLVVGNKMSEPHEYNNKSQGEHGANIFATVLGETFVINGWPYSSSSKHDWSNPNSLTCGIDASIVWSNLKLGERVRNIADIGRISGVSVRLPESTDLERLDRFSFSIITGDNQVFIFPFHLFRKEVQDKQYVADVSGYDLMQFTKRKFYKRGGRSAIPIVLR